MRRALLILAPLAFVGALLATWQAACVLLNVPSYFLPTPLAIATALAANAGTLFASAWITLSTALAAFAIVGVIALACVAAFFPIYSGALAGLRSADPELERLFDLYEASAWQRITRLRIPSAIPLALEGYKVGLGLALVGAVVGEMMAGGGGDEGLAWRILEASHLMQMDRSFAAVAALGLIAGALHLGYQLVERRALAWWRGR